MTPFFARAFALTLGTTLAALPLAAQQRRGARRTPPRTTPATVPLRRTADSLKEATIAVYQTYQPELRPFAKPAFTPSATPPDTAIQAQTYEVPQQALYYTYRALPLRPLALGQDTAAQSDDDYLRVGAGNRSTVALDGATTVLRTSNLQSVLSVQHLSQHSSLTAQSASHTDVALDGSLQQGGNTWAGRFEGARMRYGRYGFNDAVGFQNDEASRYWLLGATVGLQPARSISGVTVSPTLGVRSFTGPQIDGERSVLVAVPASLRLDTAVTLDATLSGAFTRVPIDGVTRYNNAVSLAAALNIRRGALTGRLGLTPTLGRTSDFYLLPDVSLRYQLPRTGFAVRAGATGHLNRNTLEELATQNPYLTTYRPIQSRTYEVYGGLESSFGDHLSLSARGSWWRWRDLPLFRNDYVAGDGRGFLLQQEPDAQALSLQGAAQYVIGEVLSIGASGTFFSFYQTTDSRLWHVPALQFRADVSARPIKALTLTAYASILDQIYARESTGTEVKLEGSVDVGGSGEYQIVPRWSVWIQAANLLNLRNERFLGYPAFGRTVWGGLRVKF